MIIITSKIEAVIVDTELLLGDHDIDLLLINQLFQFPHAVVLIFVLDHDRESALLAVKLVEVTFFKMLEHLGAEYSFLRNLLAVAGALLHAIEGAVVGLVQALCQVGDCILVVHALPSALLVMSALKLQILEVPHGKAIQLPDPVPASLRVVLAGRAHLQYSIVLFSRGAVGAKDLGAFSAELWVSGNVLARLASEVFDVLLVHLSLLLVSSYQAFRYEYHLPL